MGSHRKVNVAVLTAAIAIFAFAAPSRADWQVTTETSKIDDSLNVYARAFVPETVRDRFGRENAVAVWAICREGHTDFFIDFGGMMVADIQGYGRVTLRADKEKARKVDMVRSTDYRALGLWNGTGVRFLKSLIGKSSLLIVATPYNEPNVEMILPLQGFDTAIAQVRKACRW